jgi:hypothetical protein
VLSLKLCPTLLHLAAKAFFSYLFNMSNSAKKKKAPAKTVMLGVGLDSDGHKRITTGHNFALVGGTKETHDVMTEKAIKINEKLKAKGKELGEVSRDEFDDIAASVGLHRNDVKTNN